MNQDVAYQNYLLLVFAVFCFSSLGFDLCSRDYLTLKVLYHTIPHELCRCEVKDVHSLQGIVSAHSEESDSLLFILCLQEQIEGSGPEWCISTIYHA